MANLPFSSILLLFFFIQCFFVQLRAADYSLPDQYFINCGSSESTTVNGRSFVGDENPDSFTLSAALSSVATNPSTNSSSSSSDSSLYSAARIFRQASWYELNLPQDGTYVVRFHFSAFTPQAQGIDLHSARFNVSVPNFYLLSDFSVQNSSGSGNSGNSPLIKEFLFNITSGKFRISFTPTGSSSMAFVNAIETFLAPDGLIPDSAPHVNPAGSRTNDFDGLFYNALQVIHRINVGGSEVTPAVDTLLRTWIPDDDYMFFRDAAVDAPFRSQSPIYQSGWATKFDAPDPVYNTAKELNLNSSLKVQIINASWHLNVTKNSKFLIRAHFCDIISTVVTDVLKFNIFIYNFGQIIDPHSSFSSLAIPFYFDIVVDSDDSGFMNISIGPRQDSDNKTAFLNGLEIMELISNSSISISGGKEATKKHLFIIIGSVVGGVVLIIASVVVLWSCLRARRGEPVQTLEEWQLLNLNRRSSYSRSTERNVNGSPLPDLNLGLKMALGEIQYATKNFNEDLVIGEGGFGKVYRGTLRDGTKVAVKRSEPGRTQGFPEFQTEIMVLSKIRHLHLVSLIGYCDERSEMLLVYEFMEKGTLRDHLYTSKEESTKPTPQPGLSWEKRLQLCIDAVRGLHYLHTGLGGAIIHRDVKSTNILLDENFVAKVADFGISRLGPLDQSHVSTEVKGSFGYLDPEYFKCLLLTQKSDVYSFGVVLLEVLCARGAIDNTLPKEQVNLADWGMYCITKGELEMIIDPFLAGQISFDSLRRFGQIVQKCIQEYGADRPNMVDLLWELEYALRLQQTPRHLQGDNSEVSYNLPMPIISRLPSHSLAMSDDEMDSETRMNNGSSTNASEVFSQIIVQEAR